MAFYRAVLVPERTVPKDVYNKIKEKLPNSAQAKETKVVSLVPSKALVGGVEEEKWEEGHNPPPLPWVKIKILTTYFIRYQGVRGNCE